VDLLKSALALHSAYGAALLYVVDEASRARLAVLNASSRAERLAMRPLGPAVLVPVELLGTTAQIAVVGLLGHGEWCWVWRVG
jgi:hypothetical protein